MIKNILSAFFITATLGAAAQLQYTPGKSSIATGTIQDFPDYRPQIDFVDASNQGLSLTWEVIEAYAPSQWDALAICNPSSCPVASVGANGTFTVGTSNNYFRADFIHNSTAGIGRIKLKITYNGVVDTLTFGADLTSTGINDIAQVDFNLYPNPAKGNITLSFENTTEVSSIAIFDITGKNTLNAAITANKETFSIANLQSGSYLAVIYNTKNQVIGRKRIAIID